LLLAAAPDPPTAPPKISPLPLPVEAWSKNDNGIQARILLDFHDNDHANIWTYVEIQSLIAQEISISTHPHLTWSLTDSKGKNIPPGRGIKGGGGGGGEFPEQWAKLLPGGGRISIRMRPNGGFAGEPGARVLALQNQDRESPPSDASIWALSPGEYILSGTLTCEKNPDGPANQWTGKLDLPPVHFTLAAP
jgi:hypothetical protein